MIVYGGSTGGSEPVAKLDAKLPPAPIAAFCVTAFSVIATFPVGVKDPKLILPARFVVAVPYAIVGELRLLNEGVAFSTLI